MSDLKPQVKTSSSPIKVRSTSSPPRMKSDEKKSEQTQLQVKTTTPTRQNSSVRFTQNQVNSPYGQSVLIQGKKHAPSSPSTKVPSFDLSGVNTSSKMGEDGGITPPSSPNKSSLKSPTSRQKVRTERSLSVKSPTFRSPTSVSPRLVEIKDELKNLAQDLVKQGYLKIKKASDDTATSTSSELDFAYNAVVSEKMVDWSKALDFVKKNAGGIIQKLAKNLLVNYQTKTPEQCFVWLCKTLQAELKQQDVNKEALILAQFFKEIHTQVMQEVPEIYCAAKLEVLKRFTVDFFMQILLQSMRKVEQSNSSNVSEEKKYSTVVKETCFSALFKISIHPSMPESLKALQVTLLAAGTIQNSLMSPRSVKKINVISPPTFIRHNPEKQLSLDIEGIANQFAKDVQKNDLDQTKFLHDAKRYLCLEKIRDFCKEGFSFVFDPIFTARQKELLSIQKRIDKFVASKNGQEFSMLDPTFKALGDQQYKILQEISKTVLDSLTQGFNEEHPRLLPIKRLFSALKIQLVKVTQQEDAQNLSHLFFGFMHDMIQSHCVESMKKAAYSNPWQAGIKTNLLLSLTLPTLEDENQLGKKMLNALIKPLKPKFIELCKTESAINFGDLLKKAAGSFYVDLARQGFQSMWQLDRQNYYQVLSYLFDTLGSGLQNNSQDRSVKGAVDLSKQFARLFKAVCEKEGISNIDTKNPRVRQLFAQMMLEILRAIFTVVRAKGTGIEGLDDSLETWSALFQQLNELPDLFLANKQALKLAPMERLLESMLAVAPETIVKDELKALTEKGLTLRHGLVENLSDLTVSRGNSDSLASTTTNTSFSASSTSSNTNTTTKGANT